MQTNADSTGTYALSFRAAEFKVTFSKARYESRDYAFGYIGTHCDDTNQQLDVALAPK